MAADYVALGLLSGRRIEGGGLCRIGCHEVYLKCSMFNHRIRFAYTHTTRPWGSGDVRAADYVALGLWSGRQFGAADYVALGAMKFI